MANVIFKQGTQAQYNDLDPKDPGTLYWLTDVKKLYKGDKLYGTGDEATSTVAGLMSGEDKAAVELLKAGAIKSGSFKTVETADDPYEGAAVGDQYIDIVLNDKEEHHAYIPAPAMTGGGAPEWGTI